MSGHGDDDSLKAVLVAVAVNFLITVAKYVGWAITLSPSLLAEAIHSTADVANQFLLWIGIKVSKREADEDHPYGWGPARYLWNLKSAMGIFFLGAGVTLYHGVHNLLHPPAESHSDPHGIGIIILVAAVILEGGSWWVAFKGVNAQRGDLSWREFAREGDDPTGIGILLEDSAAVGGVLIALAGLGLSRVTGSILPDVIATILIGVLLGWVAVWLAKANGRLLIGASVSRKQQAAIREALEADSMIEEVKELKTTILGQGRMRVKCVVDLYEKLLAQRMREALRQDAAEIEKGGEPMKVLVDVVGRTIRITGAEVQRLERVIRKVAPAAVYIDLELT